MTRATVVRLVVVAAAALAGSACGSRTGPELNVYAAQGQEVTTPLIDAWQKKNPALRINVIRGGAGELLSRVRAEKANPLGDVFWGGALELYRANDDLFAAADVPDEATAFEARDPLKKWHPWTRNVIHLELGPGPADPAGRRRSAHCRIFPSQPARSASESQTIWKGLFPARAPLASL